MNRKLFGALASFACLVSAPAGAVPIFLDTVVDGPPGTHVFTYRAEFAKGEGIKTGSILVIFDFAGYVPGSIFAPAGITTNVEDSSGLPSFGFTDDPTIPNLEFSYTGPLIDLSEQTFADFGALSIYGATTTDGFSAITVKSNGSSLIATQGGVLVPTAIPEMGSWAMMLLGFGAVGGLLRTGRRANLAYG